MARRLTGEQLADRAFALTMGFIAAILAAIAVIWLQG